jgi:hypothetical protein
MLSRGCFGCSGKLLNIKTWKDDFCSVWVYTLNHDPWYILMGTYRYWWTWLKIGHAAIASIAEAFITNHTSLVIQDILGSTKISEIAVC